MFWILLGLFCLLHHTESYSEKYRIFLKDKGSQAFYKGSLLFETASKSISEKSKARRQKVFPADSFVTYEDVPIPEKYLKDISTTGATIVLTLKWLNYVVADATQEQVSKIQKLNFVSYIQPIYEKVPKELTHQISSNQINSDVSKLLFIPQTYEERYGESFNQLNMLAINKLHSLGILGDSIILGIIDTGFRWKGNKVFSHANVLSEYDFLYQDTITENEPIDTNIQDNHGSMVFSIIAGMKNGYLFGSAPFSDFVLAKTEDIRKETHFEEDCFARAIEWMDSIGVDLITSSLGYSKFDTTEIDYSFQDFDGRSSLISAYANRAKKVGITMISSAGNKGPADSTIQAPAEALGEIAIGAVNPTADTVLKFSSRGPTFDGRIKPDFVAQGIGVVYSPASPYDTTFLGSGTSVASPIFAGGVALLLSAFEELTPEAIYEILKNNASKKDTPNIEWGYGVVDFYNSAINYNIVISPPISFFRSGRQRIVFKVKYSKPIDYVKIFFKKDYEELYSWDFLSKVPDSDEYYYDLYPNVNDSIFHIFVVAKGVDGIERRKPFYEGKFFTIRIGETTKNIFLLEDSILKVADNDSSSIRIYQTVTKETNDIFLEIKNSDYSDYNNVKIQILNLLGMILDEFNIQNHNTNSYIYKINLDIYPSGVYLINVSVGDKESQVLKFVKLF
jgi:hypothetical protein